jgi:hypothetical protein
VDSISLLSTSSQRRLPASLQEGFTRVPRSSTILLSKLPSLRRSVRGESEDFDILASYSHFSPLRSAGHAGRSLFSKLDITMSDDDTASESSLTSTNSDTDDCPDELDIIGGNVSRQAFAKHLGWYFQSFPDFVDYESCVKQNSQLQENTDEDLSQSELNSSSGTPDKGKKVGQRREKRAQRRGDESDQKSDEDSEDRKRKKRKKTEGGYGKWDSLKLRALACPYYQRNPRRYRHQKGCAGPGWKDVHRLKYVQRQLLST